MALPKLNDIPKYDIVIPSTGIKTRYRPYLVKEEKVLLMAVESGDEKEISFATIDLIKSCVDAKIDDKKLTVFDMEYLFTQIRAKSVGENATVILKCGECSHENTVNIPLGDVSVDFSGKTKNIIPLTDKISAEMKYLSYHDLLQDNTFRNSATEAELIFNTILHSIEAIHTEEERVSLKDEPIEEVIEFVNNLTTGQFDRLKEFVENTPQVKLDIDYTCEEFNYKNEITLKGLQDFFQ